MLKKCAAEVLPAVILQRNVDIRDGDAASYCWDVVATVYLLHPELFTEDLTHCFITECGMYSGWLAPTEAADDTVLLNLPRVKDLATYREEMYRGWLDFQMGGAE